MQSNFNDLLAALERPLPDLPSSTAPRPDFAEFEPAEYELRYAKAIALMEERGLDALVVTMEEHVRYFAGYLSVLWVSKFRPLVLILPRDPSVGPTLVLPGQEEGNAAASSWVKDLVFFDDQGDPIAQIVEALRERGLGTESSTIGMELGFGMRLGMSALQHASFVEQYPGAVVDGAEVLQTVRMIKSPAEVAKIRRACEISQIGTRAGFSLLKPGMTEKEMVAISCAAMYTAGAEVSPSGTFFAVTSAANYKALNGVATDYAVREGDLVLIDGGARFEGYATDYIRQAAIGPVTDEQQRYYDIALEANNASIDALRPGVTGADVYDAGMAVFKKHGVYEYNALTIVGHAVGMEIHELPWLGERDTVYSSDTVLRAGMVVCIEPVFGGFNDPSWEKGVWIQEDKVLITESGSEVLTSDIAKEIWVQDVV